MKKENQQKKGIWNYIPFFLKTQDNAIKIEQKKTFKSTLLESLIVALRYFLPFIGVVTINWNLLFQHGVGAYISFVVSIITTYILMYQHSSNFSLTNRNLMKTIGIILLIDAGYAIINYNIFNHSFPFLFIANLILFWFFKEVLYEWNLNKIKYFNKRVYIIKSEKKCWIQKMMLILLNLFVILSVVLSASVIYDLLYITK